MIMNRLFKTIVIVVSFAALMSCAELQQIAKSLETNAPLTQNEVVSGLKEALKIGTDSAAVRLSKADGYYKDQLVKIMLPPQANTIINNIGKIPGGEKLVEDLILSINRSAEDAAKEVGPIFFSAITSMTIQDGFTILKGDKDAATQYLKKSTYDQFVNLYKPKINNSLDKKLVAGISANQTWETLTTQWNKVANSIVGKAAGFEAVDIKLDTYLTQKALDGLFLKLANEEEKIRTDPLARVTNLLKRVFGS